MAAEIAGLPTLSFAAACLKLGVVAKYYCEAHRVDGFDRRRWPFFRQPAHWANQTMASSYFRFADLKNTKATVFLVLPPERLDAYSRWLRPNWVLRLRGTVYCHKAVSASRHR